MECGGFGVAELDDFFVDQLLDFSNVLPSEAEDHPPEQQHTASPEDTVATGKEAFGVLTETEIPVPAISEDLESLEWLSRFVEDSFSNYSLTGKLPPKPPEVKSPRPATKARTKRARTGVRVWPVLSPSFTDSPSTSSSSSASSATSFQKPKKRRKSPSDGGHPRRCSHCGVSKTPQWRAGPLGSKTLCNACGVRYKSGRLLPEYRPACSPTFSAELHSNHHRRVLEMRRKKETQSDPKPAGSEILKTH